MTSTATASELVPRRGPPGPPDDARVLRRARRGAGHLRHPHPLDQGPSGPERGRVGPRAGLPGGRLVAADAAGRAADAPATARGRRCGCCWACGARRWRCPRSPRACRGCACRCWSSARRAGMADVVMNALGIAVEEHRGKSIMSGLHGMWSAGTLVGAAIGVPAAHAGLDGRVHLAAMAAVLLVVALADHRGRAGRTAGRGRGGAAAVRAAAAGGPGDRGDRLLRGVRGGRQLRLVRGLPARHRARLPRGGRARVHRVLLHDGDGPAAGRPGGTAAGRGDRAAGRRRALDARRAAGGGLSHARPRPSRASR